jgi:uncharacterized protein YqeY
LNVPNQLRADLVTARKARHPTEVSMIRTLIAAIENAEAVEAADSEEPKIGLGHDQPRRELTDDDIATIVERERTEVVEAITHYRELGLTAHLEELEERLRVVDRYRKGDGGSPDIS